MVDSWYCLDRVVPERMSQVWRRSDVRNHKRRSLNTRLSSGTSANTSCTSRNAPGRMIRSDLFWYGNNLNIKPTYREKNLLDYLFGEFRSTLNVTFWGFCAFDRLNATAERIPMKFLRFSGVFLTQMGPKVYFVNFWWNHHKGQGILWWFGKRFALMQEIITFGIDLYRQFPSSSHLEIQFRVPDVRANSVGGSIDTFFYSFYSFPCSLFLAVPVTSRYPLPSLPVPLCAFPIPHRGSWCGIPHQGFRFLVWNAPNLGLSTAKSAWDRQEGGCHSPLPKLRYGRLEERANIRAYKTCVQAQRPEFRESHVTALSVAGGAPSHTKEKPAMVR